MKIIYAKNPLQSTIELDIHEKILFWHLIKIDELVDKLSYSNYYLSREEPNIKDALYYSDYESLYKKDDEDKSKIDQRVDQLYAYLLPALTDSHYGDCICQCNTCDKCHAESLLEIRTIPGLGKHSANKIDSSLRANSDISYDDLIEKYNNYKPDWPGYEAHYPRFIQEAKDAAIWLENYKEKYKMGFEYVEINLKGE